MKGSFGLVVLVIAMAVVLLLVAQAWQRLALPAAEFARPGSTQGVAAHGQSDAVNAVHTDGTRLNKTQQKTDAHTDAVNEAIASID